MLFPSKMTTQLSNRLGSQLSGWKNMRVLFVLPGSIRANLFAWVVALTIAQQNRSRIRCAIILKHVITFIGLAVCPCQPPRHCQYWKSNELYPTLAVRFHFDIHFEHGREHVALACKLIDCWRLTFSILILNIRAKRKTVLIGPFFDPYL